MISRRRTSGLIFEPTALRVAARHRFVYAERPMDLLRARSRSELGPESLDQTGDSARALLGFPLTALSRA